MGIMKDAGVKTHRKPVPRKARFEKTAFSKQESNATLAEKRGEKLEQKSKGSFLLGPEEKKELPPEKNEDQNTTPPLSWGRKKAQGN